MQWGELVLAFVTSAVGALGGLGGAVLLVPALVLTGMSPRAAAPLGLVSVAAG
ncbi:MAG TPA: sulfite exporter TauE/SafE family protein, partial [Acidimicrobiaceae bacterium]|nr:sulfite exporter TauE/SafE family protein [Acidimicrobiaceae bacterium]